MIWLVQPPPSANSGNTTLPAPGVAARSVTGRVVIRKSDRSLVNPWSVIAVTGTEDVNVNVPLTLDPPLKGASFRNFAICPFAGIVVVPDPKLFPFESVKK